VNDNFTTIYNEFNGSINANNLASNAITSIKITDANVTTAKINDSAVTTAKIEDDAVTYAKIETPIAFRATSTQSINTNAQTTVTTFTEEFDYGSNFDHTTGLFTAPYDGIYHFSSTAQWTNIATPGRAVCWIYANGAVKATVQVDNASSTTDTAVHCSVTVSLSATQTADMNVYQSDGATLALLSSSNFSGHLVGRTD
jgi:hypothetical protein